jgi:hypothetical protein
MKSSFHMMPAQFGPLLGDTSKQLVTNDKLDVTIQLAVDADAARSLLPTWTGQDGKTYGYRPLPIGPSAKPVLSVNYTQERDVDYMAGGGYNEVEFYLSAEFVGERPWDFEGRKHNSAHGVFAVLLLPSHLIPLLAGRDAFGTPKHLADVTDLVLQKMFAEDEGRSGWFEARNSKGGAFIAGCLRNVGLIPYAALNEPVPEHFPLPEDAGWGHANDCEPGFKVLLWKYITAADWAGREPDLSYHLAASVTGGILAELSQPMAGDGNIVFPNALDANAHPNFSSAFNAIRNLIEHHSTPFPGNVLVRHYRNAYRAQDIHVMDGPRMPAS